MGLGGEKVVQKENFGNDKQLTPLLSEGNLWE